MRRLADRLCFISGRDSSISRIRATPTHCRYFTKVADGLFDRLRHMYADYELWRDRQDDSYASACAEAEQNVCSRRIRETPGACPRTVLILPAAPTLRPPRGSEPDAVMFDFTAPLGRSAAARDAVLRHVEAETCEGEEKTQQRRRRYIIRVNSPEFDARNGLLDLELVALLGDRIEAVALPMVTTHTFSLLEPYVHPAQRLWAMFDSPRSIAQAADVCAQGHYACAVLDAPSLSATLGIDFSPGSALPSADEDMETAMLRALPVLHSSFQVILAARAYGMHVLDGPFADAADTAGFARDAQRSRRIGFDGRVISHGTQVAACNQAFVPTETEMEWAQEVLRHHSQWERAARLITERYRDAEMEKEEQKQKEQTTRTTSTTTNDAHEEKEGKAEVIEREA